MPNGQIPEDLAKQKDLDLVICGDQHGPKQSVEQSNLFNLETSKQRRLYYAMAPEAMTITQNFIGSYLRLEVDPKGKVIDHERLNVGKLRFHNVVFNFDEDSTEVLEAFLSLLEDHIEETTSVRVTLKGNSSTTKSKNSERSFTMPSKISGCLRLLMNWWFSMMTMNPQTSVIPILLCVLSKRLSSPSMASMMI